MQAPKLDQESAKQLVQNESPQDDFVEPDFSWQINNWDHFRASPFSIKLLFLIYLAMVPIQLRATMEISSNLFMGLVGAVNLIISFSLVGLIWLRKPFAWKLGLAESIFFGFSIAAAMWFLKEAASTIATGQGAGTGLKMTEEQVNALFTQNIHMRGTIAVIRCVVTAVLWDLSKKYFSKKA